jgi:hypothetical protein
MIYFGLLEDHGARDHKDWFGDRDHEEIYGKKSPSIRIWLLFTEEFLHMDL